MSRDTNFRIINLANEPAFLTIGPGVSSRTSQDFWRFGSDNLFPLAIAKLNRMSPVHRGILRSKTRFISGKAVTADEKEKDLNAYLDNINADGETLRDLTRKLVFDYKGWGNAYMEIVTNRKKSFLNLYHQDVTKCRMSKDKQYILLHHDWRKYSEKKKLARKIPLYPNFEVTLGDGNLRSVIHFKEYEPEFENYGVIDWVAGLNISAIAYKTDMWNISRLDNSFHISGIMIIGGDFKDEEEYKKFNEALDNEFIGEGKQGKLLKIVQTPGKDPDTATRFVPVPAQNEGDWKDLHGQTTNDLIIAHGWFRSLCGIADNTGFDTQRILNEYEVALNTVIQDEQDVFLGWYKTIINEVLGFDTSTLAFINKPPVMAKPQYMMIWEARKADGLDYDENDPAQKLYLANIGSTKLEITAK